MKYIITESKLDNIIYQYLEDLFDDLNFTAAEDEEGYEMNSALQFYFGDYGDDESVFYWYDSDYFNNDCEKCPIVVFETDLLDKLNSLFSNKWEPIFKKWLWETFYMKVKTIE